MECVYQIKVVPDALPELNPTIDLQVISRTLPSDFLKTVTPLLGYFILTTVLVGIFSLGEVFFFGLLFCFANGYILVTRRTTTLTTTTTIIAPNSHDDDDWYSRCRQMRLEHRVYCFFFCFLFFVFRYTN
jgi:hypothetical protein